MIFGISQRALTATEFLRLPSAGHPIPATSKTGTLVAAWPALAAHTSPGDFRGWRAAQWADFLNAPLLDHPFTASPGGDRRALFRLLFALGPDDRVPNTGGWTYAAHTVLASLGLAGPDGDGPHRWIAVRAHPRHLHLIANLISEDGTWAQLPEPLLPHLQGQIRLLTRTLNQPPAHSASTPEGPAAAAPPTPNSLADLLDQITDETAGPLAQVRRQIEHTATYAPDTADPHGVGGRRRLEWIARRLYGIQEDLRDIGRTLSNPASPPPRLATAPSPHTRPTPAPAAHAPAR